jgi:hypothetical protein
MLLLLLLLLLLLVPPPTDKDTDEVDNEWFLCPMKIFHHQGELVTSTFPVENRFTGQVNGVLVNQHNQQVCRLGQSHETAFGFGCHKHLCCGEHVYGPGWCRERQRSSYKQNGELCGVLWCGEYR